jgi:hypothetical protein
MPVSREEFGSFGMDYEEDVKRKFKYFPIMYRLMLIEGPAVINRIYCREAQNLIRRPQCKLLKLIISILVFSQELARKQEDVNKEIMS